MSYVHIGEKLLWLVLLVLVLLLIEMVYIIGKRKGEEYQYFWPSGFLYLAAMLSVIWIMELFLLQERLDKRKFYVRPAHNDTIKFQGIDIKAVFNSNVAAKKVGELGLVIFIILGRWLLPRGQLTRDQLSALLLGYIGMGADILDLFTSLSHPNVIYDVTVHYVMLAVFSWSMLQFCITASVTAGSEKTRAEVIVDAEDEEKARRVSFANPAVSISDEEPAIKPGRPSVSSNNADPEKRSLLNADLLQILLPLFMQDGPFLILRLSLLIKFEVANEIHIYFTGKNFLIIALLFYRLYGLNAKEVPHTKYCEGARGSVCVESFTLETEFTDYDVSLQNVCDDVFGSSPQESIKEDNPERDDVPKPSETEPTNIGSDHSNDLKDTALGPNPMQSTGTSSSPNETSLHDSNEEPTTVIFDSDGGDSNTSF